MFFDNTFYLAEGLNRDFISVNLYSFCFLKYNWIFILRNILNEGHTLSVLMFLLTLEEISLLIINPSPLLQSLLSLVILFLSVNEWLLVFKYWGRLCLLVYREA